MELQGIGKTKMARKIAFLSATRLLIILMIMGCERSASTSQYTLNLTRTALVERGGKFFTSTAEARETFMAHTLSDIQTQTAFPTQIALQTHSLEDRLNATNIALETQYSCTMADLATQTAGHSH